MLDPAQPWGLSWPGFGIVSGLGLVLVWVMMWRARRSHDWAALPAPLPELSLEQLAYLCGGAGRAAEAVLAKLLADKIVLAGKSGRANLDAGWSEPTVQPGRHPRHPVAGLYGVAVTAVDAPIAYHDVLGLLIESPEMTPVVDRLRDRGLIGGTKTRAVLRRAGPTVLVVALLLLTVARVVSAVVDPAAWAVLPESEHVSVVFLMGLGVVVGVWTLGEWAGRDVNEYAYLTPAGLALVRALRHADNLLPPTTSTRVAVHYRDELYGPAGVVALRGLHHYPGRAVRSALYPPTPPPPRDGHAGS